MNEHGGFTKSHVFCTCIWWENINMISSKNESIAFYESSNQLLGILWLLFQHKIAENLFFYIFAFHHNERFGYVQISLAMNINRTKVLSFNSINAMQYRIYYTYTRLRNTKGSLMVPIMNLIFNQLLCFCTFNIRNH